MKSRPTEQERIQISEFVVEEGRLLDGRKFYDWLDLFDPIEAYYWIPSRPDAVTPQLEVNIVYDDRLRLQDRVRRLVETDAHSQFPPSSTLHVGGTPMVTCDMSGREDMSWIPSSSDLEYLCTSTFIVAEHRRQETRFFACAAQHSFIRSESGIRIRGKKVRVLGAESVTENLSFLI